MRSENENEFKVRFHKEKCVKLKSGAMFCRLPWTIHVIVLCLGAFYQDCVKRNNTRNYVYKHLFLMLETAFYSNMGR